MFKKIFLALAVLTLSLSAHADIIYNLSSVTLTGGGTLTGTFSTNNARTVITAAHITASAQGAFAGFTYTLAGVSANSGPTLFQFDQGGDELRLQFSGVGLTTTGGTFLTSSYEFEGPSRTILTGSAVVAPSPTPEPASFVLLGTGLLGIAGATRRRFVKQ